MKYLMTIILFSVLFLLLQILPAPSSSTSTIGDSPLLVESTKILPLLRADLTKQLTEAGVIDPEKIAAEELSELNLLWAFGLANKNPILETGPMIDPRYGGAERFASTGGWTLAKGNAMDHYSQHQFVTLTPEQQALVEKLAKNIYRPCCDNPTYFPDCNHGMAMLGLLELLAANDVNEDEMWQIALRANRLWFPDAYAAIDQYLKVNDREPMAVAPQEILGAVYSSASGYQRILSQITPPASGRGVGCGL